MRFLLFLTLCVAFIQNGSSQDFEGILKINGTELQVKTVGTGPPIIILHGGPGLNYSYFLPQVADLRTTHRLIFFDQRASGRSSGALDTSQMSLDLFVDDIDAIRSQFGFDQVTVLGHSWGGLLAMKYAIRYSKHLSALILVNTVSPRAKEFEDETNKTIRLRTTRNDSLARAEILTSEEFKSGKAAAFQKILKLSFVPTFHNRNYIDSLTLRIDDDFPTKRKLLFLLSKDLSNYNLYEELKAMKAPVLIIHGESDAIPLALPRKLNATFPNSKLVPVKNAGHFPFVEQRHVFSKAVRDFLRN